MREQIFKIVESNPKTYTSIIKSKANKDLHDWILKNSIIQGTKTYAEMVYSALYQESNICQFSSRKKTFKNIRNGYNFCGNQGVCICNKEHSQEKIKETNLSLYGVARYNNSERMLETKKERYGDSAYNNRPLMKETNLMRYGNECPLRLDKFKKKSKDTSIEKYGVSHPAKSAEIRNKIKETNLDRYGVEWYGNTEKGRKTQIERYGILKKQEHYTDEIKQILFDKNAFVEFITDKNKKYAADNIGIDTTTIIKYAELYNCTGLFNNKVSNIEMIISNMLSSYNVRVEYNNRKIISPYELDFFLPEYNVAIEVNGNYWHSEIVSGRTKYYHYNKWKSCQDKGIDLYSYFEDEINDKTHIIESKIKYLLGINNSVIGARKCIIRTIQWDEEKEFLIKNHIQGASTSRNGAIGAYHNDSLVAIMSWMQRKDYLEITRYCCDTKASYPGLFSKMMKHMIKELVFKGKIVSFSNNGHSNGNVYSKCGFTAESVLPPSYWYITTPYSHRENRQKYMKSKISKRFGVDMTDKTEWQAMQELGYDRIWDSGKIKWQKIIN